MGWSRCYSHFSITNGRMVFHKHSANSEGERGGIITLLGVRTKGKWRKAAHVEVTRPQGCVELRDHVSSPHPFSSFRPFTPSAPREGHCPGANKAGGETKAAGGEDGERERRGKSSAGARQGERFPLLQSPPRGASGPADVVRPPRPPSRPPSWAGSGAAEGQEEAAEGKRRRRWRSTGSGEAAVGARAWRAAAAAAAAPEGTGRGCAVGPPLRARAALREEGGRSARLWGDGVRRPWAAAAASPVRTCPALPWQGRGRQQPVRPVPELCAGACRAHPAPPQPSGDRWQSGSHLCGWGGCVAVPPSASRCVTAVRRSVSASARRRGWLRASPALCLPPSACLVTSLP